MSAAAAVVFFLTIAASVTGAPSTSAGSLVQRQACNAGTYQCDPSGVAIDVCTSEGTWVLAGSCPDNNVCEYLPQNGFQLPYCVNATDAASTKRAAPPCQPGTYQCAKNPTTGASGIKVCNVQFKYEYIGDCPKKSHCEYFPSNIPYCVN